MGQRLDELIAQELRAGRCLVLIDGLDEVTTAQDRASVVESISNFVAVQQPRGNRFVTTSRISGYAAAPLPPAFAAARLLELDDDSIERFLRLYAPAIERAEATAKDPAIHLQDAACAVDDLAEALRKSPGVRRLATNPLLLTALLLVQRTRGALPDRRVDAYKAATDALGHAWRVTQGIPEAELPEERRLTQWLTRLAEWMHAFRPEGSATLRDLLAQWGPLWAKMQRQPWNEELLDDADPTTSDAGTFILEFVNQVERHTGLLVERAPQRWGFPHLTFEEFYAGRALAFEGRVSDRAGRIRQRLHDARYDEPILLALGLIARDQPEQLEAIFDAALLARGEDAERLQLRASEFEELLGRDFLFALRALADEIPASPARIDALLQRAIEEALESRSRARFQTYRRALLERVGALVSVSAGTRAAELLAGRVNDELLRDKKKRQRFLELAGRCPRHPVVAEALSAIMEGENLREAMSAARVLGTQGNLSTDTVEWLTDIVLAGDNIDARTAATILSEQPELAAAVLERLTNTIATTPNTLVALFTGQVLGAQQQLPPRTIARLTDVVTTTKDSVVAITAADLVGRYGDLPVSCVERLSDIIATINNSNAARAVDLLQGQPKLTVSTIERVVDIAAIGKNNHAVAAATRLLQT
ncbi:MAG TPA: hypothetical protein VIZ32_09170 [Vicinamibacterales bacterium]